jgi:hypothetical protein
MHKLLEELLSKKEEGVWWDFKQKFHKDLFDLLHDVICLANVIHDGERHIVFGISDQFEVIGLDGNNKSYTQADIISYLRQQPFAENNVPTVKLNFFDFTEKKIAILSISNERVKPYYFTKEIKLRNKFLRAGTIYSRIGDTNTPKDSCANPSDIKAMWLEKFGLDLPVPKRFSYILEDTKSWVYNGIDSAYYELDPDFTIKIGETELKGEQYWWQKVLIEEPIKYNYILKFKSTVIHELPIVHFQNENLCIPFPDIEFVTYPEKNDGLGADFYCDLFYYKKGTLLYSLFKHLRGIEIAHPSDASLDTPIKSQIKPPIINLPFFVVDSDIQLESLKCAILEQFKVFMHKKKSIVKASMYADKELNRWQLERVFAEWVYSRVCTNI